MKFSEVSQKPVEALRKELADLRQELNGLEVKNRLGQVKNFNQIGLLKKDIARILTAIKYKI